jgi:hypothetical protein
VTGRGTETETGKPKASAARARKAAQTPLPEGFAVSDRVAAWAAERSVDHLDQHLESFISKCRAKGYTYADWDEALMGAIRADWAQLRGRPNGGGGNQNKQESLEERNRRIAEAWTPPPDPVEVAR